MRQSRLMSLVEAVANVVVGYGVAVLTQMLVFPLFGLTGGFRQNLAIGLVFTAVSIVRGATCEAIRWQTIVLEPTLRRTARPLRAMSAHQVARGTMSASLTDRSSVGLVLRPSGHQGLVAISVEKTW